jgi:hypothetical protein
MCLWFTRPVRDVGPFAPLRSESEAQGSSPKPLEGGPHVGTFRALRNLTDQDCLLESQASFVSGLPPGFGGVAWKRV